ncbi:MAG: hypothetical protein AAGC93_10015 [Cyanobacteria bacterium P01_F01_bin.53]
MKMTNMQAIASNTNANMDMISMPLWHRGRPTHTLQKLILLFLGSLLLGSCAAHSAPEKRKITLQQQWTLNPGDEISGNIVAGSLGDISLALKQGHIKAPFEGELEPTDLESCALYSSPEIPAYLFRLCGLKSFKYGAIKAGDHIGKGEFLSFATLRRQPDGTWIIVEPARGVLEKALTQ